VLGVEALEGRITVAEGEISLKATQTELDDVEARLGSAEITLNSIDAPSVTIAVGEIRQISDKQEDLSELTLQEVIARYKDRKYVTQDVAFARQEFVADINEQREAIASVTTVLGAQIEDNRASIVSEQIARATADSALAVQVDTLSSTVGNNTTTISQVAASIDGVEGKYGVTIDNNGNATGFQLLSGVGGSAFNVRADQFAVFNSTGAGGDNPFTIFTSSRTIGGVVYPAGTYIQNAYIDDASIVNGSITNAKIGNTIQSSNFVSGTSGWQILKDGSAEFNGVVISRQLQVDSGSQFVGNVINTGSVTPIEESPIWIKTNVPVSAWAGTNKTYLVAISNSGSVTANTSDVSNRPTLIRWGFRGELVPLTQWSGSPFLWLKVIPTGSLVTSTSLTINWKIYEVT
jgi:hypothetical protein